MVDSEDWVRLGRRVRKARQKAGIRSTDAFSMAVERATGERISGKTLGSLERGTVVSFDTLWRVEETLGWPEDEARRELERASLDGSAAATKDDAASTTDEAIRNDPTLSEEARAHLLNQLRLLRLLPPEAVTGEPTPRRRDHATPAEGSPVRPSAQHDRGNRATGRAARTAADAKASAGGKRPRAGAKER